MVANGAEWTDVSWSLVNETVAYHLVLSLKPFTAFAPWAIFNWAVMGPIGRMNVRVCAAIVNFSNQHGKVGYTHFNRYRVVNSSPQLG